MLAFSLIHSVFDDLPELPDDLAEAFDCMKLAILRQKLDGWTQISEQDTLRMLDLLKGVVRQP
jgi:hypothetical protein